MSISHKIPKHLRGTNWVKYTQKEAVNPLGGGHILSPRLGKSTYPNPLEKYKKKMRIEYYCFEKST